MSMRLSRKVCLRSAVLGLAVVLSGSPAVPGQVLDKQKLLDDQTFWDNRDWDWYKANLPFFECPVAALNTTYYYRWESVTKHLTYGSPNSGYSFTEFIDRPFWSGTYGAISCPAGHQLYEVRWLRDKRYAQDYGRYWFKTPGAQPRRYSTWLADALWAVHEVHPDDAHIKALLPDLIKNYEGWEKEHFVLEVGLFWQTGHDDGMEININSRQTRDRVRGAPGYRPTLNSYLWADALAIARIADLAGEKTVAAAFRSKATALKSNLQSKLWDSRRQFFLQRYKQDETADGYTIKAGSLTYETGRFAGNPHGREEIGFVPWQFNLPDPGYEAAWKFLMKRDYFFADFGPTTVERHDPQFLISKTCCVWSGQSWPYATTQTLKALGNVLQNYRQQVVTRVDYVKLLEVFARTHRKAGKPYLAEAADPDTGSWEGHDSYNHSEHYFHSGFNDLIITGLVGLKPRPDDVVEVQPLAPEEWEYFALDDLLYHGRRMSILWDRDGKRYGRGKGLHILADGKEIASSEHLERVTVQLAPAADTVTRHPLHVNFAVSNDGGYYPKVTASYVNAKAPPSKVNDGNYWYHLSPPNRWTCEGSRHDSDWCAVDFGTPRPIDAVKLYLLDDGSRISLPGKFELQYWTGNAWATVPEQTRSPLEPTGHRANVVHFPQVETSKIRAVFTHGPKGRVGLTEFEVWGRAALPVTPEAAPAGNLALNPGDRIFPKASASFTSRFDRLKMVNDGAISFNPTPANRWTTFGSPNTSDWLEIDFGRANEFSRIELAIYDDRGGVQAPAAYIVQFWDGQKWVEAPNQTKAPELPVGGMLNEVCFDKVRAAKVRVLFVHQGKARSGLSEIFVWPQ